MGNQAETVSFRLTIPREALADLSSLIDGETREGLGSVEAASLLQGVFSGCLGEYLGEPVPVTITAASDSYVSR